MTGTDADDADAEAGAGVADPPERREGPAPGTVLDAEAPAPIDPDAFQALGNETRLSVLRHLLDREDEGRPVTAFSALQEATGADSSAGFAYHLRQLTDRYVRKVDREDEDGYALTYAGRKVARAVAAGTYTDSVDFAPVPLADPCPHCGADGLLARAADNVVGIACEECGRPVLSLPFPPQGHRDRPAEAIPRAFDRHHRHRLSMLREGVCPECAGQVEAVVESPPVPVDAGDADDPGVPAPDDAPADRLQAAFECSACGHGIRTPVTLALLSHPAVIAFHHDHGIDVRERPLWNVGGEWRESLLSTDPWAVVVSAELDGEVLELYVDRSLEVVDTRRIAVE
jgi:DNA-binding transcriptional ArsR family regulator